MKDIIEDYVQDTISAWNKETQRVVNNFSKALRRDRETGIRERLIKLGWTPPNLTELAGEWICDNCGKPRSIKCHSCSTPDPQTACEYQGPKHGAIPPMQMDYGDTPVEHILRKAILEGEPFLKPKWIKRDPDPLRVRVARELGKKIRYFIGEWEEYFPGLDAWLPVLRRDKKVELAMGALGEYCEENSDQPTLVFLNNMNKWVVSFQISDAIKTDHSLPQAICEAIVAHAEGK